MGLQDPESVGRLAYLVLLLSGLVVFFVAGRRMPFLRVVRDLGLWVLIFALVIIVYGFRDVLTRELFPRAAYKIDDRTIALRRAGNGHFMATLDVNGVDVRFVVDTGASGIVLSKDDARRVGLPLAALDYTGRAVTANGAVRTAPVRLDTVRFGPFEDRGVRASVNEGMQRTSLLGMDYLGRFRAIEITGDTMTLRR